MSRFRRGGSRGRAARWLGAALLLGSAAGCGRSVAPAGAGPVTVRAAALPAQYPPLGRGQEIEPGVRCCAVSLPGPEGASRLWIYLPERRAGKKLPCLFIAAAGSHLFDGMALGEGDRPEHLPYARAGYAVVAYETDGMLPDHPTGPQLLAAARAFEAADAGLVNAREAIAYTLARVPGIDPQRLYTAGHSSAAIPGWQAFIERRSPQTGVARLRCPVFLFHADDVTVVPTPAVAAFAAALRRTNRRVTLVQVPSGNHYNSMIQQGIPTAIKWLRRLRS